jgi:hypothetical protein
MAAEVGGIPLKYFWKAQKHSNHKIHPAKNSLGEQIRRLEFLIYLAMTFGNFVKSNLISVI